MNDEQLTDMYEDFRDDIKESETFTREHLMGNSCPHIDEVFKDLSRVERILSQSHRYSSIEDLISDISPHLGFIEKEMETIRRTNTSLREIGIRWRETCTTHFNRLDKHM